MWHTSISILLYYLSLLLEGPSPMCVCDFTLFSPQAMKSLFFHPLRISYYIFSLIITFSFFFLYISSSRFLLNLSDPYCLLIAFPLLLSLINQRWHKWPSRGSRSIKILKAQCHRQRDTFRAVGWVKSNLIITMIRQLLPVLAIVPFHIKFALPKMIAPALRNLATTVASCLTLACSSAVDPAKSR